ncbi:glycosyltransferase family 4 protein [Paenibacillus sp. OV219]|uniref:glycosyltransferase family 4 protein n=1 Tax=Paenibacillus sp. OV219 TaxID=1884377 RepID=UPI0008D500DA|nr:glycosyltransferase family 4 protein [Paenibacillus sp. OV219]SEM54085.1 1,2-diacylglycerol-3-alpha-glucose alpha-1,2-galactosyltransferase [Paenibacillus sp. OV219]
MPTINMLSSAHKVKGQGVLSAYIEQVKLVETELFDTYQVVKNHWIPGKITHYHTIDFKFFLSLPLAKLFGKTVAYVHFVPETIEESLKLPPLVKKIFYAYMLRFYRSVDHIVVVNPYFIDVLKTLGISEQKVTYIPNFVSEERFFRQPAANIAKLKHKYGLPNNPFIVLGVGQVQTRKGVMDFIETAKRLPHICFVWAGGFSFGAITEGYTELKKWVDDPPANVTFTGIVEREEMNDLYNVADLMFLPSHSELFPMSILEAIALRIPVLLRDLELYPAILFDHYLKGDSVDSFVSIISTLQIKDGTYDYWSDQSWKCHEYYSEKRVASLWRAFYDRICTEQL